MDVQADLSLCSSHKSYCRFCRELAHIIRSEDVPRFSVNMVCFHGGKKKNDRSIMNKMSLLVAQVLLVVLLCVGSYRRSSLYRHSIQQQNSL